MERQHYRSPQLIRRTHCCGAEAGVENGRTWCTCCGQQIMRASDVLRAFRAPPPAPAVSEHLQGHVRRSRAVAEGQGALL